MHPTSHVPAPPEAPLSLLERLYRPVPELGLAEVLAHELGRWRTADWIHTDVEALDAGERGWSFVARRVPRREPRSEQRWVSVRLPLLQWDAASGVVRVAAGASDGAREVAVREALGPCLQLGEASRSEWLPIDLASNPAAPTEARFEGRGDLPGHVPVVVTPLAPGAAGGPAPRALGRLMPPGGVVTAGDEQRWITLARELASAVDHLHGRGWVHGDLKAAHVVARDVAGLWRDVRLVDVSAARPVGALGAAEAEAARRTDLAALGLLLVEALLGGRALRRLAPHSTGLGLLERGRGVGPAGRISPVEELSRALVMDGEAHPVREAARQACLRLLRAPEEALDTRAALAGFREALEDVRQVAHQASTRRGGGGEPGAPGGSIDTRRGPTGVSRAPEGTLRLLAGLLDEAEARRRADEITRRRGVPLADVDTATLLGALDQGEVVGWEVHLLDRAAHAVSWPLSRREQAARAALLGLGPAEGGDPRVLAAVADLRLQAAAGLRWWGQLVQARLDADAPLPGAPPRIDGEALACLTWLRVSRAEALGEEVRDDDIDLLLTAGGAWGTPSFVVAARRLRARSLGRAAGGAPGEEADRAGRELLVAAATAIEAGALDLFATCLIDAVALLPGLGPEAPSALRRPVYDAAADAALVAADLRAALNLPRAAAEAYTAAAAALLAFEEADASAEAAGWLQLAENNLGVLPQRPPETLVHLRGRALTAWRERAPLQLGPCAGPDPEGWLGRRFAAGTTALLLGALRRVSEADPDGGSALATGTVGPLLGRIDAHTPARAAHTPAGPGARVLLFDDPLLDGAAPLLARGCEVWAVSTLEDLEARPRAQREREHLRWIEAERVGDLPSELPGELDLVLLLEPWRLSGEVPALCHLAGHLRPGGILALSAPIQLGPIPQADWRALRVSPWGPGLRPAAATIRALQASGLTILEASNQQALLHRRCRAWVEALRPVGLGAPEPRQAALEGTFRLGARLTQRRPERGLVGPVGLLWIVAMRQVDPAPVS